MCFNQSKFCTCNVHLNGSVITDNLRHGSGGVDLFGILIFFIQDINNTCVFTFRQHKRYSI